MKFGVVFPQTEIGCDAIAIREPHFDPHIDPHIDPHNLCVDLASPDAHVAFLRRVSGGI